MRKADVICDVDRWWTLLRAAGRPCRPGPQGGPPQKGVGSAFPYQTQTPKGPKKIYASSF